jgi:colanic acid/amylovoran biosynthesis glycosyltransferase
MSTINREGNCGHSRCIGFLVPEFPGQTHIFLWRERQALEELGFSVNLISTRRPDRGIMPHSWTTEAQAQTSYLLPLKSADIFGCTKELMRAGPLAWGRMLWAVISAQDLTIRQRFRLVAMSFVSAKLIRLAREQGWAHVHVHSCADSAHIAMLAWLLDRLSYSLTLHGPTLEGYGPNQRQKWQHARFATVISQKLLKVVDTQLTGARPADVAVAAMGVDLSTIRRKQPYRPWQAGSPLRIFSCGRLNPVKGHDFLIDAVAALRSQGFDAQLEIAGQDESGGSGYRQTLARQIEAVGLTNEIQLLGAVPEERVRAGLEQAHVFVIASLDEGISVAIMEAMAMELPVIATDVGGNSELIDNGVNAIMVPPTNIDALVEAIRTVVEDPSYANRLASSSRTRIENAFHHRVSANALARCLSKMAFSP